MLWCKRVVRRAPGRGRSLAGARGSVYVYMHARLVYTLSITTHRLKTCRVTSWV